MRDSIFVRLCLVFIGAAFGTSLAVAETTATLPNTRLLEAEGDLSAQMVAGIHRYLDRLMAASVATRSRFWRRDHASADAYVKAVEPNRERFRRSIGATDERQPVTALELLRTTDGPALLYETDRFRVLRVRWPVFPDVHGEGLLLEPKQPPRARLVVLPDADETPEMATGLTAGGEQLASHMARRLAEAGCQVIVPVLIDRACTWSGNPDVTLTDQPHREWVYRQAFEMGRHIIGYEVQKVQAVIDWFSHQNDRDAAPLPVGVAGYGEGGLLALYTAAVDIRVGAALVSGYFDSRQKLHAEPIYRNVFGLLREFGDAEIASLVFPRALIVEYSKGPSVAGPPPLEPGRRRTAAPGEIAPPAFESVRQEFDRAKALCNPERLGLDTVQLISGVDGEAVGPGSRRALQVFLKHLGGPPEADGWKEKASDSTVSALADFDAAPRQRRQLRELVEYSQRLLRRAESIRGEFWNNVKPTTPEEWLEITKPYKKHYWDEIVGRLPDPSIPINPRVRKIDESAAWSCYEVMLDVWPDVYAWGYLLVPHGIQPGERRPVVVCQHGLESLPESVVTTDESSRAFRPYRAYATLLAERGFVTYAPHNPYRGETAFRQLQRKANPLKLTLFSFILGQHERTLEWLSQLPFVDADRIGFYGLSYGGLSAVRIPSLLDRYALSISSAGFNDWTRKIMSISFRSSYMFVREYEQFVFNQGSTFNHAELAGLIAPRPFMVERGHDDGVAPDEWVAYEYAKVRRLYTRLGVPERTEIEFFDGGHRINAQGTFDFLHRYLNWPKK